MLQGALPLATRPARALEPIAIHTTTPAELPGQSPHGSLAKTETWISVSKPPGKQKETLPRAALRKQAAGSRNQPPQNCMGRARKHM